MNVTPLFNVMIALFFLLLVGYIARKTSVINSVSSKNLSKLIISIGQPMMIVGALNGAEYNQENVRLALIATGVGFLMHTVMALLGFLICLKMKNVSRKKIFEFSLVFANCGFLGFPVLDSIFGGGMGSFLGAFYLISFHIFIWTWGIFIIGRGRDDIKLTPKKAFLNYGTVPCAIGVALYFLKPIFVLPKPFGMLFSYLGSLCTPVSMLITGGLLATASLSSLFRNKSLYLQSFLKLLVFPMLICLLTKLLGFGDQMIILCTVMAGLPSASMVTMLAELYDLEPTYSSQIVGMSSLLTTATLPLMMLFANWVIAL